MSDAGKGFWGIILRIYTALLLAAGVGLMVGGGQLITLGGSPYYLVFGLAVAVSAILLLQWRAEGAALYGLAFLATLAWAVWEVGSNGWALVPRLAAPAVVGLILLIPGIQRTLTRGSITWPKGSCIIAVVLALIAGPALRAIAPLPASPDPVYQNGNTTASAPHDVAANATPGNWQHYGNDLAGTRYSALTQITPENVAQLTQVWDLHLGVSPGGSEATPIKIGNTLYLCTSTNDVLALDAETGKEVWRFEPHVDFSKTVHPSCRGVSYYHVPDATGPCAERIISNTLDARLFAVDAHDGSRCADFGNNGEVSLLTGLGEVLRGYYFATSAPTVAQGKIIIGGYIADNQSTDEPSGVIRAFDAVTGKFVWAWDMGNPDRSTEPPPGEYYTRGTPNSWPPLSVDESLGLVYAPMGNPPPDYFAAHRRPFDEAYGSTVVALDLGTGKPRWSFQTTHHDVWDYDNPAQPTLADYTTPEGVVHAVLQPTKRGELFVLDRATGKPLAAVEEHPAPQAGAAPEEKLSPTQPFAVGMPSFRGPDLHEADMWGITPLDQLWCRVQFRESRYDGPLTPPGVTPSIQSPGFLGGMEWGGVAYDAGREIVIVNSNIVPNRVQLIPRTDADKLGMRPFDDSDKAVGNAINAAAQKGTPYGVFAGPFLSPLGVPCKQPPYGRLSAVDLKSGKLIWTQEFGTAADSGPLGIPSGLPLPMGVPNIGGAAITQSGLFFIGSSQDKYLRAFDTTSGKMLWQTRLPSGGQSTPMTYEVGGRQYVVIATGGHMIFPGVKDVHILAYALPKSGG